MRILILSDSHSNPYALRRAINEQPSVKDIFFLGDLTDDIEKIKDEYPNKTFRIVSGNCDRASLYPTVGFDTVNGKKIMFTHGHKYSVKFTLSHLMDTAKQNGVDIALFGHTHIAWTEYADGVYLINPGSVSESRRGPNSYAVIDIEENGILPVIIKLK